MYFYIFKDSNKKSCFREYKKDKLNMYNQMPSKVTK